MPDHRFNPASNNVRSSSVKSSPEKSSPKKYQQTKPAPAIRGFLKLNTFESEDESESESTSSTDESPDLSELTSCGFKITKSYVEPLNIKPFSFPLEPSLCMPMQSPTRRLFESIKPEADESDSSEDASPNSDSEEQ